MDVKAVCKGQRATETTRRTELFAEADVGGLPGEREKCRLMGSSRAKNTLAWAWGDLAGPPAAHVMFRFGLFPRLYCQGWDLRCGSPDLASLMMDRWMPLMGHEASIGPSTGSWFLLICKSQDALS